MQSTLLPNVPETLPSAAEISSAKRRAERALREAIARREAEEGRTRRAVAPGRDIGDAHADEARFSR